MNANDFTYLLNNPNAVSEQQALMLDKIVAEFPYFQSAKALQLKVLHNENSFRYNQNLKITAAHTTDRNVLFEFITSEDFAVAPNSVPKQVEIIENEYFVPASVESKLEQSILNSIIEATLVTEEEIETEISIEEENKLEQSILSSIIEATSPTEKVEKRIESKLEQSILSSIDLAISAAEKITETAITDEISIEPENEEKNIEEKLEIGKPLDFSSQEKHSFQEWLQLASLQPIKREETTEVKEATEVSETAKSPENIEAEQKNIEENEERKKKLALIDKFIEANPRITPAKNTAVTPFISEQPAIENSYLMTETLAKVYLEQKKYQKAIQAYEILILKYPEKISFFASRISDIKALQQNNN